MHAADGSPCRPPRRATLAAALALLCLGSGVASAAPRAELLTYGPGDPLYARFGHTAIRVMDPAAGQDSVYAFGYAPFDSDTFLWELVRGDARFYLGVRPWRENLEVYRQYDRTVRVRTLNLSPGQAAALAGRLAHLALPENRFYVYDSQLDNCATRVRDLLDEVTSGALRSAAGGGVPGHTYRHDNLAAGAGALAIGAALDLVTGPHMETPLDGWAAAYLPTELEALAAAATVQVRGKTLPLAGPPRVAQRRSGPPPLQGNPRAGRIAVAAAGATLGLLLLATGRRRWWRAHGALTALAGLLFGLLGCILWTLVLTSRVPALSWNENILVFTPLDLLWVVAGARMIHAGRPGTGRWLARYLDLRLAVLGVLGLGKLAGWMVQDNLTFMACAALVLLGLRISRGHLL